MERIETARLTLLRLDAEQMRMLALRGGQAALEERLGLSPAPEEAANVFAGNYYAKLSGADGGWYRFWYFVGRAERAIVGGALFKGGPNDVGEVEIGYGLTEGFREKGYATEGVGAVTQWAQGQPGVRAVVAETERDNVASHRVLQKLGFRLYQEEDGFLWWRKEGE